MERLEERSSHRISQLLSSLALPHYQRVCANYRMLIECCMLSVLHLKEDDFCCKVSNIHSNINLILR